MKTKRNRNWMWGILLLLLAAGLVANQFWMFGPFGFWTIAAAVTALVLLVSAITHRTISTLPFVAALVYVVLRNLELVPHVAAWILFVAALLASAGIGLIFPQKVPKGARVAVGSFADWDEDDWDDYDEDERDEYRKRARATMGEIDNNPSVSVSFGSTSRYLHADRLETAALSCNFGGMGVYFDQVELAPDGATVHLDCKFGGIDIYVPRHWHVEEQIHCTVGGVDINTRRAMPTTDGPRLKITGHVLFGGVDIWYI